MQIIPPKSPRLPDPPQTGPTTGYVVGLLNVLRLYFNQIDNALRELILATNQAPFNTRVAQGLVPGYSSFSVFGYNPDVDTAEESVWPDGGQVPHPAAASPLTIVSTDTNDDGSPVGTGARTVYIEGLDGDYKVVSETITMNGTTGVITTKSYLYVNQFYVATVGSGGSNAGEITAKVSTTLYDLIAVGNNQRTTGHYCVPAGYTGYLMVGTFSCGQVSGSTSVTAYLKSHGPDGILRVTAVTTLNNGSAQFNFENPIRIPEKFCIGATAVGSANNNSASSMFNIMLVRN